MLFQHEKFDFFFSTLRVKHGAVKKAQQSVILLANLVHGLHAKESLSVYTCKIFNFLHFKFYIVVAHMS